MIKLKELLENKWMLTLVITIPSILLVAVVGSVLALTHQSTEELTAEDNGGIDQLLSDQEMPHEEDETMIETPETFEVDEQRLKTIVETWLTNKQNFLGEDLDDSGLNAIATGQFEEDTEGAIAWLERNNAYYEFETVVGDVIGVGFYIDVEVEENSTLIQGRSETTTNIDETVRYFIDGDRITDSMLLD